MTDIDETSELQDPGPPGDEDAEELLEQAQLNAQSAIIATVAYLNANEIDIQSWTKSLGMTFSLAWDEGEDRWEADEFLQAMLVNFRSLGAEATEIETSTIRAAALIQGFPNAELLELFGVEIADAAQYMDTAIPIAEARGLTWEWDLDGDHIRILVRRVDQ